MNPKPKSEVIVAAIFFKLGFVFGFILKLKTS